jgi:hypothetical protein
MLRYVFQDVKESQANSIKGASPSSVPAWSHALGKAGRRINSFFVEVIAITFLTKQFSQLNYCTKCIDYEGLFRLVRQCQAPRRSQW